jgi:prepilin-type N-terminal cleavage/methylation domain-containing protein
VELDVIGRLMLERARRVASDDGDAGYSMIEMVVGMVIMAIAMAMFGSAIFLIFRASEETEARGWSATQLNIVFQHLDNEVRYAANISTPDQVVDPVTGHTDWYFVLEDTTAAANVTAPAVQTSATCYAYRIDQDNLEQTTWTVKSGVTGTVPAWTTLTSLITNGSAPAGSTQPFSLIALDLVAPFPTTNAVELTVQLTAANTEDGTTESTQTDTKYIALNTTSGSTSGGLCAGGATP